MITGSKSRSNVQNIINYLFKSDLEYMHSLIMAIHDKQFQITGTHNFTAKGKTYVSVKDEPIAILHKSLRLELQEYFQEANRLQGELDTVYRFLLCKTDYYNYLPDGLINKLNLTKPEDKTHEVPEEVYNLILEKTLNHLLE